MSSLNPADQASQRRDALDAKAVITLLVCCILWGLNQIAAKVTLADVPPLLQAAWRSSGAVVLVVAWALWRRVPLWTRDGSLPGGLLAGVLFGAEFACIFLGLQFTTASRMVVYLYSAPFIVALGMPFIAKGERLSALQWAGLVVAFAGVAVAFAEGFGQAPLGPRVWVGDALGVAAAVFWALTTLVIRATRLGQAPAEKTLAYQLAVSAAMFWIMSWAVAEAWPQRISTLSWVSLAFQTVVVAFASFLTWFWLVRHYPAARLSSFTLVTPLAGLAFGVILLGEPLTARLLTAASAVAVGLLLINRPVRRRPS
jgi:drug/metabolite transporter (DMT)-like permease